MDYPEMNETLKEIFDNRADLSDYLFHFTKGKNGPNTLQKILESKAILDIGKRGHICFTDSPILQLEDMFQIFDRKYPKNPYYTRYGIGVKKDVLFKLGARQVTYVPDDEYNQLPENLKWRHQIHEPLISDFSWLREWRLPVDTFVLDPENCFFITKFSWEVQNFTSPPTPEDISISIFPELDGSEFVIKEWYVTRRYKGISFEEVNSLKHKNEINNVLETQILGDILEIKELAAGQLIKRPNK
jgi:hypothetical protein